MGDSGRSMDDTVISGVITAGGVGMLSCHFIFMLFVVGNIVRDEE